ncbi:MAG: hypothetical protein CL556_11090 [Alphaproteobacteria bacterium]|jgi:hypothetical protein|nr:hypothetical protein [Alphaproteobacteria bacterium]MAJ64492.1 hypothetical protein [Alphaproteobacteria bacterium]MAJ64524.1 hypothetical protein [Alphaproteobacteria bacterium]MBN59131.1 hypothetical protein [Oceanospirillaceae bacterium]|tara:strand:- start:105 stop:476 length:372 start_codon:yes stop_codon:yes gene_type:complete
MVRRIHLHMDMDESEAAMIRNAARLVKLRPSYYVLNRILRVAEWEIGELTQQNKVQGPPEDIDAGSGVSEGVSGGSSGGPGRTGGQGEGQDDDQDELSAEKVKQRLIERRARKIPGGKVAPLA